MSRIGIYPGTFDPIHTGHLAFASNTLETCQLDQVVFLPEDKPRSKANSTPLEYRSRDIASAITAEARFTIALVETSRFTVTKTLPKIQTLYPNAQLTLLVGSDVFIGLNLWKDIGSLLRLCDIAIGIRSGQTDLEIRSIIGTIQQEYKSNTTFTIIHTDHPSITSSKLRSFL